MAKRIEAMSAKELFELAQRKEAEERESAAQQAKSEIESLRNARRELNAKYKKELGAIDRQIRSLAAATGSPSRGGGRGLRQQGVSDRVVALIRKHGPISLKELRNKLESGGADTRNLGQTLAYLKSRGAVETPERAVYNIA